VNSLVAATIVRVRPFQCNATTINIPLRRRRRWSRRRRRPPCRRPSSRATEWRRRRTASPARTLESSLRIVRHVRINNGARKHESKQQRTFRRRRVGMVTMELAFIGCPKLGAGGLGHHDHRDVDVRRRVLVGADHPLQICAVREDRRLVGGPPSHQYLPRGSS
jgi:hypothetical protein